MIATQYKTIIPASPIYRLSLQSEPSILLENPCSRRSDYDSSSNRFSHPPIVSPRHSRASKMSSSDTLRPPTPPGMQRGHISSPTADDSHATIEALSSEDDSTPAISVQGSNGSRTSSHGSVDEPHNEHIIHLSSIEQVMPRAYIRVCLAYRVPSEEHLQLAIERLRMRVRKIVDAKPYLSGHVTDVKLPNQEVGRAEIRFTTHGYLKYPTVEVRTLLNSDGSQIDYDELDQAGLPPSRLRPEDVSALLPNVDPSILAPVFRIQANLVKGGLIVSIYLHHCISDGTGLDLITTGGILNDENTFYRPEPSDPESTLEHKLKVFARQKTRIRQELSYVPPDLPNHRNLKGRRLDGPATPGNAPGRGCVVMISSQKISSLLDRCNNMDSCCQTPAHTKNSLLMAMLWRHMTRARRPSIAQNTNVKTSSLLIPVDIRRKLQRPLLPSYFGAAVDSAKAELTLDALTASTGMSLREVSLAIRESVAKVDDLFVREAVALANTTDKMVDVTDLQASCMDRATGADMYITSWLRLKTYASDLGMGLGGPDWVRKPWSRDPGSCIILPQKSENPDYYEVVVQMTEKDMERLLGDEEFMDFVVRVID